MTAHSNTAEIERRWLAEVLTLAEQNVAAGGGPFGALIGHGDRVLARAGDRVTRTYDPTAHAEIAAIRRACRSLGDFRLTGATLISSCEPCPMCMSAALWARVARIVFAADRHTAAAGFDDHQFYELFGRPRTDWPMGAMQIDHPDAGSPFTAWSETQDRIRY